MVKLDVDTLSTLPIDPPSAGSDRAFDPPPPDPAPPGKPPPGAPCPAVVEGAEAAVEGAVASEAVAVAEGDPARPTETPIPAHPRAAAAIQPRFLFDSNRRTPDRCACSAVPTEADMSGEDAGGKGGAAPPPPALPATDGPDVALETEPAERFWSGVAGSYSFMMALLSLGQSGKSDGHFCECPMGEH
jgi:hypothetical protein